MNPSKRVNINYWELSEAVKAIVFNSSGMRQKGRLPSEYLIAVWQTYTFSSPNLHLSLSLSLRKHIVEYF